MNVFFMTVDDVIDLSERSIYMDLINEFLDKGHYVTIASVCEKRNWPKRKFAKVYTDSKCEIYKIYTYNITKNKNYIEKGFALFHLMYEVRKTAIQAMKFRYYDLVVYGSPPVTFFSAARVIKQKQNAYCYLLLKDIWPYDCLFGDVLTKTGWKRIAFNYLAYLARKLYSVSDKIGCMSPANIKFLLENEPQLDVEKLEVNPNSIQPFNIMLTEQEKNRLRDKYNIPRDKVGFVYGGNLGVPQGIDFAIESVKASATVEDAFFVFVGGGTEQEKIDILKKEKLVNFLFLPAMPRNDYETLVFACDVGLIYLNFECLSPNFPSRLLAYMQAALPVLCATDLYTDVGKIAEENGYGLWCESNNVNGFVQCVEKLCNVDIRKEMGAFAYQYLLKEYSVEHSYETIMKHIVYKENDNESIDD